MGIKDKIKNQWKGMWRERIEDRVRAEGIAKQDYPLLFVERGTVIIATRDYKPLSFNEILQQHLSSSTEGKGKDVVPPNPFIGGWRKFIREVISKQKRFTLRRRASSPEPKSRKKQPLKKGGRGWMHRSKRTAPYLTDIESFNDPFRN